MSTVCKWCTTTHERCRAGRKCCPDCAHPCPLTAREGPYRLTCIRETGHDGDCWCTDITVVGQED